VLRTEPDAVAFTEIDRILFRGDLRRIARHALVRRLRRVQAKGMAALAQTLPVSLKRVQAGASLARLLAHLSPDVASSANLR